MNHSRKSEYINESTSLIVPEIPQRPLRNRLNQLLTLSKSTTCISLDASPIFTNNSTITTAIPYKSNFPTNELYNGYTTHENSSSNPTRCLLDDNNSGTTLSTVIRHNTNNSHKKHQNQHDIEEDEPQASFNNDAYTVKARDSLFQPKIMTTQLNQSYQNTYKWPIVFHNPNQIPCVIDSSYLYPMDHFNDKISNISLNPNTYQQHIDQTQQNSDQFPTVQPPILPHYVGKNFLLPDNLDRFSQILNQPALVNENEDLRRKLEEANSRLEYLEALEMHVNYLEVLFAEIVASQQRQNTIHNQIYSVSMPSIISNLPMGGNTPKRHIKTNLRSNRKFPNKNSAFTRDKTNEAMFPTQSYSHSTAGNHNNTSKNSSRTVSLDRYQGTDSSKVPSSLSFVQEFQKDSSVSQLEKEQSPLKTESSCEFQEISKEKENNKIDFYLHSSETGYEDGIEEDNLKEIPRKSPISLLDPYVEESSIKNTNSSPLCDDTFLNQNNLKEGGETTSNCSMNTVVRNYPSPGRIMKTGATSVTPGCARRVRLMMKQKIPRDLNFSDDNQCTHEKSTSSKPSSIKATSSKPNLNSSMEDPEFDFCKEITEDTTSVNQNGSGSYEGVSSIYPSNNDSTLLIPKYQSVTSPNHCQDVPKPANKIATPSSSKAKQNSLLFLDKFKNVFYSNREDPDNTSSMKDLSEQKSFLLNNHLKNKFNFSTPPTSRKAKMYAYDQQTIGFRSPPLGVGSRHNSFASDRPRLQTFQQINTQKKNFVSQKGEISQNNNNTGPNRRPFYNKF